ncbi:hypothetical protein JOF55_004877 [Haloactinomyces albus]|uniref:HD domain-containing protein n=1 Tax=Haloactinomyces albus TaxID=1352928 RepID=A0AAE4CSF0_9ACTN|nr:hypothetical protein [Haloactinomyces albus]
MFFWGSLRGHEQGLRFDPELLHVGAMFHDLGLTERFRRTDQRFEIDGADEARRFLHAHGVTGEQADRVWTAIALHTTPEIPLHMTSEIALVTRGVELDVLGIGYDAVSDEQRAAVVAAHPRPGLQKPAPGRVHRGHQGPPRDDVRQRQGRRARPLRPRIRPRRLRRSHQKLRLAGIAIPPPRPA